MIVKLVILLTPMAWQSATLAAQHQICIDMLPALWHRILPELCSLSADFRFYSGGYPKGPEADREAG